MKKLILSLLCIGSILALPACCCRKTCEEPCENYCDDYDDCYDDESGDDRDIVGYEEQQGYRKPIYRKGTGPDREAGGYEEQQGYRMPLSSKRGGRTARPMMHEPVDKEIMRRAADQGKVAEYCNPAHATHGKKIYKERMSSGEAKEMMEVGE